MIISKLIAKLLPLILKQVLKAVLPKLEPLEKYVNEPNELDREVKALRKKVARLERRLHG